MVLALNQKIQITNDIQHSLEYKTTDFQKSEDARAGLQQQLRDYIHRSEEESRRNKEYQDKLLAEIAHFQREIESLTREKAERDQTIRQLQSTNLQHRNEIMRLEQELKVRIDIEIQLRTALENVWILTEQKEKLKKDLDTASDYLLEQDDKVYKANQTSLELLKNLKDAELEIETLKEYIIELKQRVAVYIPVRDDNVDVRLAEYINNYPDRSRLKIMFMRESEGIY